MTAQKPGRLEPPPGCRWTLAALRYWAACYRDAFRARRKAAR